MESDTKVFGFWIYLMTDLIIFAVLFATLLVLRDATYGGPSGHQLLDVPYAFVETLILLTSSFTCAVALRKVQNKERNGAVFWFLVTFALGAWFLSRELVEFSRFVAQGASWQRSAFLSSFFTLVGTHGLHIAIGLLWLLVTVVRLVLRPLVDSTIVKIFLPGIFWHFLDFVWIFIFTVVYGMGHLLCI